MGSNFRSSGVHVSCIIIVSGTGRVNALIYYLSMFPTLARLSKASRLALTPKRGNKDYYKGDFDI